MQGWKAGTKWTRFTLALVDRETILTYMRRNSVVGVMVDQHKYTACPNLTGLFVNYGCIHKHLGSSAISSNIPRAK
jgi:hypothetical protein